MPADQMTPDEKRLSKNQIIQGLTRVLGMLLEATDSKRVIVDFSRIGDDEGDLHMKFCKKPKRIK